MWQYRNLGKKNRSIEGAEQADEFCMEMQPLGSSSTPPKFLRNGDVVMLMWKKHNEADIPITPEGLKLANLELLVYHQRHKLPADVEVASFRVESSSCDANQSDITYGSKIKLRHCSKFVKLGKKIVRLDGTDTHNNTGRQLRKYVKLEGEIAKLDSSDIHDNTGKQIDLFDKSEVRDFKILNPDKQEEPSKPHQSRAIKVELSKPDQWMLQEQGLYVFTLVTNEKRLTLHKIPDSIDLNSIFTVKLYYYVIPDAIINGISRNDCLSGVNRRNFFVEIKKHLIQSKASKVCPSCKTMLLEQLGSICDHNMLRQNYLHHQSSIPNTDLVYEVCILLNKPTTTDVNILEGCLKALIKMCVGNNENQEVFLKEELNMLNTVKLILKEDQKQGPSGIKEGSHSGQTSDEDIRKNLLRRLNLKDLLKLKELAVSMLEILCEHETERKKEISETEGSFNKTIKVDICRVYKIDRKIGIITLHENMVYCYQHRDEDEAAIEAAIKTHNLLKHLDDEFEEIKAVPSKHQLRSGEWDVKYEIIHNFYEDKRHREAWNYCVHWSRNIEVLYKDKLGEDKLEKVYFRLRPEDELTPKEECVLKNAVNCGRPKDRLTLFLLGMDSIKKKVHQYQLFDFKYCPSQRKILLISEWLNYFLTFWTLVMNILLVIAWEYVDIKSENVYYSPTTLHNNGSMLNSYCVEAVCYNNSVNNAIFTPEDCSGGSCVSEQRIPTIPDVEDDPHWFFSYVLYIGGSFHLFLSLLMAMLFLFLNAPDFSAPYKDDILDQVYEYVLQKGKPQNYFEKLKTPRYFEISFLTVCFRLTYVFGFVVCSALALRFYGYFYCFCLIHVVVDNKILQRVLKSITRNFSRLFWLVVLGMAMIYIYSVGAFIFFADKFHDPESDEAQYCNTLLQCYVTISHYILIGGTPTLPSNFKDFAIRVIIFEVTFYIIISIVGINIIYAIVVDTFIELREEIWQINRDNKQICFICQIFSSKFEKKAKGFDHHIMNDHYMTNYIYYKLHIDQVMKSGGTLTDIEWYVNEKIKAKSIDFFPLRRAKCLDHASKEDKLNKLQKTENKMKEMQSVITSSVSVV